MTIEFAAFIVVAAAYACYLVWKWQEAAMAPPPYQEPLKEAPVAKEEIQATWPFPIGGKRP